jgi:hypothetical protein
VHYGAHMSELRQKLLTAYRMGNFLQTAVEATFDTEEKVNNVADTLVLLHNEGHIDLIEQFKGLRNCQDSGLDFFLARDLLERSLPRIMAPLQHVMECVAHIAAEAGHDMTANSIFTPFMDFCMADSTRLEQGLELVKSFPSKYMDFISSIIVAGTMMQTARYFHEAIVLSADEDLEIRKRAIFSLGRIQYGGQFELAKKALERLKELAAEEADDNLLANAISSICKISRADHSLVDECAMVLDRALIKGGADCLYAASEAFGIRSEELPALLLNVIIGHLRRMNPTHMGTLRNIDYGARKLLKRNDPSQGIQFLEDLLLAHAEDFSLKSLTGVVHGIPSEDNKLLNKLLTRWFLKGDHNLGEGIYEIVNAVHGRELQLEIDMEELPSVDLRYLLFLSRKTIGYLFLKPVTAASVIISLMRLVTDVAAVKSLGSLLFNPLLLNYPGSLRKFLESRMAIETGQTRDVIQAALDTFTSYLDDLKSVGNIPEMHPSQDQREAQSRHFHQGFSKSYNQAMKGSILNLICTTNVILYGRKSINYVPDPLGQSQRIEIPMASHEMKFEFPQQEQIDPFGLELMLRFFRAERL